VQALEIDHGILRRHHQEQRVFPILEEQILGVPARNHTAQRLRLLHGEQGRMRHGPV
jgi:hypothetical protein